jgi:CheY-like chemotaxis protein
MLTVDPRPPNHLLASLSESDFELIGSHLEPISLEPNDVLEKPHRPIDFVCFPESGVLSVVPSVCRDHPVEVAVVGREGMSGIAVVMGSDRSQNSVFVQIAGRGQRLSSERLRIAMEKSPSLQTLFLGFVQALMTQTAHTAVVNGRGSVEQRLARWLLMTHDRIQGDELHVTHEFLSMLLGVRRAGVTAAFHVLQAKRLLTATRGRIVIKNRAGLEKAAGDYYGTAEMEYERLTGWVSHHRIAIARNTPAASPNMLVVDDDLTFAYALRRFFEANGYRVVTANGTVNALQAMKDNRFDIVVTDIRFQGGEPDGLQLAAKINDEAPTLPVICVTAYPELVNGSPVPRGTKVFSKPVELPVLRQAIQFTLAGNRR